MTKEELERTLSDVSQTEEKLDEGFGVAARIVSNPISKDEAQTVVFEGLLRKVVHESGYNRTFVLGDSSGTHASWEVSLSRYSSEPVPPDEAGHLGYRYQIFNGRSVLQIR